jgi:hypothetical protein
MLKRKCEQRGRQRWTDCTEDGNDSLPHTIRRSQRALIGSGRCDIYKYGGYWFEFNIKLKVKGRFAPYDISIRIAIASWHATNTQTIGETPHRRASRLITGNNRNIGMNELIPAMKRILAPKRLMIFAKKKAWKTPLTRPYMPRMIPMVDGGRLRPPCSIGEE